MTQEEMIRATNDFFGYTTGTTRVYNYTLTGDYATDDAYVQKVAALVEQFKGEFELNYAHKSNLYRFEIGGRFKNQSTANRFSTAMEAL
jgi:hypothetical protein